MAARVLRTVALSTLSALSALAALCAVTALIAVVPAEPPAGALETNTLGIVPVDESDNFHVELVPGEEMERRAAITNRTDQAHHVRVYPVDANVTDQGSFALAGRDAIPTGVGAWLHLPVSELVLPPRSTTELAFRVTVPAGATPGDHAGGVVVEMDPKGQPQDLGNNIAVQMNVVERIGVRVYLNVAGKAVRTLGMGELTWGRTGDGIRFEVLVTNTGNVRVEPRAELTFHGFRLPSTAVEMSRVETLLPGSDVTLTGLWRDPPRLASGHATVTVTVGGQPMGHVSTRLRLIPVLPLALTAGVGALVVVAVVKAGRFLRRARRALRLVATRAESF
jgi:hypothetical protein